MMQQKVGSAVVQLLQDSGVRQVFSIPGSLMPLLHDFAQASKISLYSAHHEDSLGYMAMGAYLQTGALPVLLVTQGPGVTNMATVTSCAWRDRIPLLILTGRPKRQCRVDFQDSTGLFHSPNVLEMFTPITEQQILFTQHTLDDAWRQLQGWLKKREGPCFVEWEENVSELLHAFPPCFPEREVPKISMKEVLDKIPEASKTVFLVGEGARGIANEGLFSYVQNRGWRLATTLKALDTVPPDTYGFIGNVGLLGQQRGNEYLKEDCLRLIACGASLNRMTTARWIKGFSARGGTAVIVDENGGQPENLTVERRLNIDFQAVEYLEEEAKKDTAVYHHWMKETLFSRHRTWTMESFRKKLFQRSFLRPKDRMICSSSFGPLGCALPLAIGAALAERHRDYFVLCGDGGFLFSSNCLATVVEYQLPICIFVFVNGEYKTVADAQRRKYGESFCTSLILPKWEKLAEAFGIQMSKIDSEEGLISQLVQFVDCSKPILLIASDDIW